MQHVKVLIAANHELSYQSVGRTVVSGVDDATVCFRGSESDFRALFNQSRADLIPGELSGNGTADVTPPPIIATSYMVIPPN